MKRHTAEEVIPMLRQAEADLGQGPSPAQVYQNLGLIPAEFTENSEHPSHQLAGPDAGHPSLQDLDVTLQGLGEVDHLPRRGFEHVPDAVGQLIELPPQVLFGGEG
jgi:hypothetical protein